MNKKRLYRSGGDLHERGRRISSEMAPKIKAMFEEYRRFNPRDLELIIHTLAHIFSNVYVHREGRDEGGPIISPS